MRTRIYISSPISKGDVNENLNKARAAGDKLLRAGYAPLVPQLTMYWSTDIPCNYGGTDIPHHVWLDHDLSWVAVSDVILRLQGESVGCDQEVEWARQMGIPIFYSVDILMDHIPSQREEVRQHQERKMGFVPTVDRMMEAVPYDD